MRHPVLNFNHLPDHLQDTKWHCSRGRDPSKEKENSSATYQLDNIDPFICLYTLNITSVLEEFLFIHNNYKLFIKVYRRTTLYLIFILY